MIRQQEAQQIFASLRNAQATIVMISNPQLGSFIPDGQAMRPVTIDSVTRQRRNIK